MLGDAITSKRLDFDAFKILREGKYDMRTRQMVKEESLRLLININDLQRFAPDRHKALLSTAQKEIVAIQRAIKEKVSNTHPAYVIGKEFQVGFEGSFGSKHLTPRYLFISIDLVTLLIHVSKGLFPRETLGTLSAWREL